MSHKFHDSFPDRVVYLPAVPAEKCLADVLSGLNTLDDLIRAAIAGVVNAGNQVIEHFGQQVVTADEVREQLSPLDAALAHLFGLTQADYQAMRAANQNDTSAEAVRWLLPNETEEIQHGYSVCDNYFRFVRVRDMSARAWLGSLAFVALSVVEDLPYILLNLDETLALLNAITIQFAWSLPDGEFSTPALPARPTPTPPWQSEVDAHGRTVAIAYFRLLVGHHIWQHFSVMARELFDESAQAFAAQRDTEATEKLWKATHLFRGTTATMWYASIFPRKIYQNELRPTMVETDAIDAQVQHLTYNLLKLSIKKLKATLEARIQSGQPLQSQRAFEILQEFYELYVQDMEQHVFVAHSRVWLDSSLAQKVWQAKLPPQSRTKNAMDLLRDMAVLRRKDWQKILAIPVAE